MTQESNNTTLIFFAAVGVVLVVVIIVVMLWVQNLFPSGAAQSSEGAAFNFNSGRRVKLQSAIVPSEADEADLVSAEAEQPAASTGGSTEAAAATEVDLEATIAAVNKGGCTACHTIPDIPGAVGVVGPSLANIGLDGADRRPGYTAEEYIRESLLEPNAFTAPECPTGPCIAGTMPQVWLENDEVEVIVGYLSTLGAGG